MGAGKLGDDAFEYYLGLGSARSYDAVAKHFGVVKRTVAKRAKAEKWQRRLSEIEARHGREPTRQRSAPSRRASSSI